MTIGEYLTTTRQYLDARVLARITRLDLRARLVVEGFITGGHRSPYHGFAVEFASHREYVPGDEIRHIDWKVWARQDRLYIKEYEEETNLRCTLVLDASRSMAYGGVVGESSEQWSKFDHAATTVASLAYLLQQQQDAIGLVTFDSKVRQTLPPSAHGSHLKQLFAALQETRPEALTDVAGVFTQLVEAVGRRGLVALVSDLLVEPGELRKALTMMRRKRHEVVVFHVLHDDELTFPFQDPTQFEGLEVSMEVRADPTALRRSYLAVMQRYLAEVKTICAELGIDYVLLNTSESLDAALTGYLTFRQKVARMRRR